MSSLTPDPSVGASVPVPARHPRLDPLADRYAARTQALFAIEETAFFARHGDGAAARWERAERSASALGTAAVAPPAVPVQST